MKHGQGSGFASLPLPSLLSLHRSIMLHTPFMREIVLFGDVFEDADAFGGVDLVFGFVLRRCKKMRRMDCWEFR
mgnify:CR=1 FL=1